MSLTSGSVSLKRLKVLTQGSSGDLSALEARIVEHRISPIPFGEPIEKAVGWCHPFSGSPQLGALRDTLFGQALALGMRLETKKIPATLFQLQVDGALEALLGAPDAGQSDNRRKAPKKLRDATRDRIREEMLRSTLPSVRLLQAIWHLDTQEVWLMSSSKGLFGEFELLFQTTFGLSFVGLNAGTLGLSSDLSLESLAAANRRAELVPLSFHDIQDPAPVHPPLVEASDAPF